MKVSFASDNTAAVHPAVLQSIQKAAAGEGFARAYGDDEITAQARARFKEVFGNSAEAFFVYNGTAANVLGLAAVVKPFESVLATRISHLNVDECGAFERLVGARLIALDVEGGKIRSSDLAPALAGKGDPHRSQPRVVSISQSTEEGRVYQPAEVRALADFAHANGMLLHVDGARFANAAAFLGLGLRELSADLGVDVLSFGGTKNGLMFGEAVVFFNRPEAADFAFVRKQGLHLASKMRFISAQFLALLENDLWLKGAQHANAMARLLEKRLREEAELEPLYPVEANAMFVKLPKAAAEELRQEFYFYDWDTQASSVRLMASFETRVEQVEAFARAAAKCLQKAR